MLDNIYLVEEDERIENGKCGIIEDTRKYYILEVLQPVGIMNLLLNLFVLDADNFFELGLVREVLPVVGLVEGEVGIVCRLVRSESRNGGMGDRYIRVRLRHRE